MGPPCSHWAWGPPPTALGSSGPLQANARDHLRSGSCCSWTRPWACLGVACQGWGCQGPPRSPLGFLLSKSWDLPPTVAGTGTSRQGSGTPALGHEPVSRARRPPYLGSFGGRGQTMAVGAVHHARLSLLTLGQGAGGSIRGRLRGCPAPPCQAPRAPTPRQAAPSPSPSSPGGPAGLQTPGLPLAQLVPAGERAAVRGRTGDRTPVTAAALS